MILWPAKALSRNYRFASTMPTAVEIMVLDVDFVYSQSDFPVIDASCFCDLGHSVIASTEWLR
jgi:hypothetical protein